MDIFLEMKIIVYFSFFLCESENEDACLDFSKQASGVYFVVVTTAEGRKKASRVVKQ